MMDEEGFYSLGCIIEYEIFVNRKKHIIEENEKDPGKLAILEFYIERIENNPDKKIDFSRRKSILSHINKMTENYI